MYPSGYYGYYYPGYGYSGYYYPDYGYYSYVPTTSTAIGAAPYLTNQTYEPGDGYRYPLYFNPVTGSYFYYPVLR